MAARSADGTKDLFEARPQKAPAHYLIAYSDGGARGNPGHAGYGVVIKDESGKKIAALSEYLGHQTNNFAEYQGLIAALEYALVHGPKALQVISDSELLVRQMQGIYKVKNPKLQDLHARAKQLIAQLDWFSVGHARREHNREADELANAAMDEGTARGRAPRARMGTGGSPGPIAPRPPAPAEFEGTVIRGGLIRLRGGDLREGTQVQVRVKE
jgi:ribonuclease HI